MSCAPNVFLSPEEDAQHPSTMSIRELIAALASIEDRMRHLPTLVPFRGQLVPNPERRLLLRRQGAVIATLRRRRSTLRSAAHHH